MALLQPFGDVPPSEGVRVLLIDPLVAYASSVIRVLNSLRRCKLEKRALITPILLLTLFAQLAYSQSAIKAPDMVPPSPKSENFLRFGNYPVNPSTGAPDISIPLYTVRSGKLEVPITLRYHIGNVKPGYDHSDVGFGWVLDVGGQVSRTIYGAPDDARPKPNVKKVSSQLDEWVFDDFIYLRNSVDKSYDTEYDVFNYCLLSQSGKFIINKNKEGAYQADVFPYKPLRFEFATEPNQNATTGELLSTIKIKDSNGDMYVFGDGATEYCGDPTAIYGYTSWMLKKITGANQFDQVNFSYRKMPIVTNNPEVSPFDHLTISMHNPEEYAIINSINCIYPNIRPVVSYERTFYGALQRYQELSPQEISFNGGRVVFGFSTDGKFIENFTVYDSQNNPVKKVEFVKSSFGGMQNHTRLDAIRVYNDNQTQFQLYQFRYNPSLIDDNNLTGRDYWGYYNGELDGCTKRPYEYSYWDSCIGCKKNVELGIATKQPNEVAAQAEILTKIVYPTNGETEFLYEGNKYTGFVGNIFAGSDIPAGGLRIREIVNKDPQGSETKKSYQYEGGFVEHSPTEAVNYKTSTFNVVESNENYLVYENSSYGNTIFGDLGGNQVRYSKVIETLGSNSGNDGRVIYFYEYKNLDDYSVYSAGIGAGIGCARRNISVRRNWDNGMLYKKEIQKKDDKGTFITVSKECNIYQSDRDKSYDNLHVFSITTFLGGNSLYDQWLWRNNIRKDGRSGPLPPYPMFGYYDYHIETGRTHLNQKRTVSYFDRQGVVDSLVTVENYYYDNPAHDLATRTETTTSRGNKVTTFTTYPLDYSSDSPLFVKDMQDNGLVTYPIESISCVTKGTNQYVISGIANQYKTGARGLLDSQWMLSTCTPIALGSFKFSNRPLGVPLSSGSSTAFIPDSRYVRKVSYDSYDSYANLTAYHMEGDSPTEIVWGYKKQRPVAIAKGANGKLNDAVKQALKYVGCNSLDSLTGSVPYVDNILNNPNIWDTFNRKLREMLPHVEVKTFTYLPLIGITSETDSRGKTVKYAYDSFGRLMNVTELGKLVSSYDYKYYNQVASSGSFSSKRYSWTFSKNTCPNGYVGGGVVYTVPEGKYTSTISQADADAKAQVEAKDRGQAYANDNGVCYYLNTNTSSVAIAPNPGLNSTLIITSNTDWSIQGVPDWLSVSMTFGSGDATITMTPTVAYDSSQQRRATLTLQATNVSISKTIEVFQ